MSTAKDKPYAATPRLVPRPTAASAARAAKNATNRCQTSPATQRQSPIRSPPSPVTSKIKTTASRNGAKSESKTEIKVSSTQEADSSLAMSDEVIVNEHEKPIHYPSTDEIQEIQASSNSGENDIQAMEDAVQVQIVEAIEHSAKIAPIPGSVSRPQTPRSVSSRPRTPKVPSRPTTPARCDQRRSTSRPDTPSTRPRNPTVPSLPAPATPELPKCTPPDSTIKEDDDLKSLYFSKEKQFNRMKKELDMKQQAILEIFGGLRVLRDYMMREGIAGAGEGWKELVMFNVADWAPEELAQLCRDAVATPDADGALELFKTIDPIDDCILADVESMTLKIPGRFADLCLQAFTSRQEIIDWVKDLIENHEFMDRIAHYNEQGLEFCETLREMKMKADEVVNNVTRISKRVYQERSTLLSVGETLLHEIARLRQDLENSGTAILEIQKTTAEPDITKAYEEICRELEEERAAKTAIKDKQTTTESQLRQARLRISKMDKQLREAEASISSLTGTLKTLEDQNRQREVHLEAKARKLKESLKTGEVSNAQLAQKRDSLQTEVNDLKNQIQTMSMQYKADVQDLNGKLKELSTALEDQKSLTESVMEQKQEVEIFLGHSQNTMEELKAQVTELENSKPNPDLPTEREIDLWAELQATKELLRNMEEEVTATKMEKVLFLETLSKVAESENKVEIQQKLAAELLNKEKKLAKMQIQIRELTKNIKLNEEKVIQYEQYVRDLRTHTNYQEGPNGISFEDLQKEFLSLRITHLDVVHRNEELKQILSQKELQLEQQDKTSQDQARVIKVREELINMLKNKETEQSRELSTLQNDLEHRMKVVDEVNKQIASKADEIQELFVTLENKHQQIHRLEKIVLALEEQHRRAQAQRTRQEEKIAALEREITSSGIRRQRKFIFF